MTNDYPFPLSRDLRPQRGGWAQGLYSCTCHKCSKEFCGDKRAVTCADCAYAEPDAPPPAAFTPEKIAELRKVKVIPGHVTHITLIAALDEIERLTKEAAVWQKCYATMKELREAAESERVALRAERDAAIAEIERLTTANIVAEENEKITASFLETCTRQRDAAIAERDAAIAERDGLRVMLRDNGPFTDADIDAALTKDTPNAK
jgi:hypothetical protein